MKVNSRLMLSIGVCLLAGAIGSLFTFSEIPTWYAGLAKPAFAPPNWVFGPVWTVLYVVMGVALYLVWKKAASRRAFYGLHLFAIQLALNVLWSLLFFGFHSPELAFAGILLLWVAILLTIQQFTKVDKRAAYLLMPYLFWVSFAAVLNYEIWILNV